MVEGQIVVTGASKGIGAAIAMALSERGFDVACLSRSGTSPVGDGVTCDMTDEDAVRAVFAKIAETVPITGLVNNAGIHLTSASAALATAEYEKVMALNATAVMVASREIHPYLKRAEGGTIVNIGSFFDRMGVSENLAYCASKAAVAAQTRCLAVEWSCDNIKVINVAPGYVETDLNREFLSRDKVRQWLSRRIPVGRAGKPEEVGQFVAALYTENIPFLTGETIYLDGGQGVNH